VQRITRFQATQRQLGPPGSRNSAVLPSVVEPPTQGPPHPLSPLMLLFVTPLIARNVHEQPGSIVKVLVSGKKLQLAADKQYLLNGCPAGSSVGSQSGAVTAMRKFLTSGWRRYALAFVVWRLDLLAELPRSSGCAMARGRRYEHAARQLPTAVSPFGIERGPTRCSVPAPRVTARIGS
jgi:hypothetical protein